MPGKKGGVKGRGNVGNKTEDRGQKTWGGGKKDVGQKRGGEANVGGNSLASQERKKARWKKTGKKVNKSLM